MNALPRIACVTRVNDFLKTIFIVYMYYIATFTPVDLWKKVIIVVCVFSGNRNIY